MYKQSNKVIYLNPGLLSTSLSYETVQWESSDWFPCTFIPSFISGFRHKIESHWTAACRFIQLRCPFPQQPLALTLHKGMIINQHSLTFHG